MWDKFNSNSDIGSRKLKFVIICGESSPIKPIGLLLKNISADLPGINRSFSFFLLVVNASPKFNLKIIEGEGHWLILHNPIALDKVLEEFLNEINIHTQS